MALVNLADELETIISFTYTSIYMVHVSSE
jgi:hypothetical protein